MSSRATSTRAVRGESPADAAGPGGRPDPPAPAHRNEVVLLGRLSGDPLSRTLPSGDEVATWRLVVERDPRRDPVRAGDRRDATVDTIACVSHRPGVRRSVLARAPGDLLEVTGSLRRRFWRSPTGATSRCEVEVVTLRWVR